MNWSLFLGTLVGLLFGMAYVAAYGPLWNGDYEWVAWILMVPFTIWVWRRS